MMVNLDVDVLVFVKENYFELVIKMNILDNSRFCNFLFIIIILVYLIWSMFKRYNYICYIYFILYML